MVQFQYLIPFHRENIYIKAVSIGAVTDILLNLLLIPFFGASGAVISTLGAEILVCGYQMHYIREIYRIRQLFKMLLPFVICGVLEFTVTYLLCS